MLIAFVVFYLVMGITVAAIVYTLNKNDEDLKALTGWQWIAATLMVFIVWPTIMILLLVITIKEEYASKHKHL